MPSARLPDRAGPGDSPPAPGVSAEQLMGVVRVHLDRIHDAVRRLGRDEPDAVGVVEASALDLVDAVARRPSTVSDVVGWWFARARELALRQGPAAGELPLGRGLLSVDERQLVLAESLERLPEHERAALLLRDSYDLPVPSVAAGLAADPEVAMDLVGQARLAFLSLTGEPVPAVPEHGVPLATLARLGEGSRALPGDAAGRRHARSCTSCDAVVAAQERAHLLLAGLTVVALPEAERGAVLERIEQRAFAVLPTGAALAKAVQAWEDDDAPRSPLLLALLGLVAAVALGIGLGALASRLSTPAVDPSAAANVLPPVTAPPALSPDPVPSADLTPEPEPEASVFVVPERTTPPPATPSPAATTAPGVATRLLLDPASGPDGATVTVTGTGWTPGDPVRLDYLAPDGSATGSETVVTPSGDGGFETELVLTDPSGATGAHEVLATDGTRTRTATYTVVA